MIHDGDDDDDDDNDDDDDDDDDDLSRLLLGLAISHATLAGSCVLDFHHYSPSRQSPTCLHYSSFMTCRRTVSCGLPMRRSNGRIHTYTHTHKHIPHTHTTHTYHTHTHARTHTHTHTHIHTYKHTYARRTFQLMICIFPKKITNN